MITRYFFSKDGDYLGGFEGEGALATVPKDAVEVSQPPEHGLDKLIDGALVSYVAEVSLSSHLNAIFELLDENMQADLAPLKAAVKLELDQGRPHIAKLIIQRANIPSELDMLRQKMLAKFIN